MKSLPQILVADDDAAIVASLRLLLSNAGFEVNQATSPQEALYLAGQQAPDLILLDMNYSRDTTSGNEGLELIKKLRQRDEQIPIIVMTGWATIDIAVSAMQQGANDFIQKPWDNHRLLSVLKAQLQIAEGKQNQSRLKRENQILKDDLNDHTVPMIAESDSMQLLLTQAQMAAQSDVSILITGENGTGKSMLAAYIHQHSSRANMPFISVNMGAIPDNLFESELFGHAKGAFTDAKSRRLGRVELADGGTLFLDEIGNIPLAQQSKLLHLVESKQFEVVGSSHSQRADVRIICATNADLQMMVEQQTFRMDLLYRLNTVTLRLPSLRERTADILPLARAFCTIMGEQYSKPGLALSEHAQAALISYHWPGNIRELSHVIERAVIFTQDNSISADNLMLQESNTTTQALSEQDALKSMAELEKQAILERLAHFDGNANLAADSLGLSRSAFYRRMDKYNI